MPSRGDSVRVFFALMPPPETREAILAIQGRLDLAGKPVVPQNIHMTLAFLGQVPEVRLPDLCAIAASVPLHSEILSLDRVGGFPRAAVVFLAPSEVTSGLIRFQQHLVEALEQAGFRPDRKRWRPHVTLYRKMRKPCHTMAVEPVEWRIRDYGLVASILRSNGPEYRLIQRWNAVE